MNERSIAYLALHPKVYIYNNPPVYFWFKMFEFFALVSICNEVKKVTDETIPGDPCK
jgi:hypothetical protein